MELPDFTSSSIAYLAENPKTINEYLVSISSFLNWLESLERIERNPLKNVQKVKDNCEMMRPRRAFGDDEFKRLLRVAGPRKVAYKARTHDVHTFRNWLNMLISHEVLGGKVLVYKREESRFWECSARINGRNYRISTKDDSLSHARDIAEDWFLELHGKSRAGLLKHERTFKEVAEQFIKEYGVIMEGQRSARWVEGHAREAVRPIFSVDSKHALGPTETPCSDEPRGKSAWRVV